MLKTRFSLLVFLEKTGIKGYVIEHDDLSNTTSLEASIKLGVEKGSYLKTIILTNETETLCVSALIPGDKCLSIQSVMKETGLKSLKIASRESIIRLTGTDHSNVSIFDTFGKCVVIADESIRNYSKIVVPFGSTTHSFVTEPQELEKLGIPFTNISVDCNE